MHKKIMVVVLLVMMMVGGVATAATPSVFEAGLVNSYSLQDFADTDFANYTPGVRMTFYITEWFGLSGEVLVDAPFGSGSFEIGDMFVSTDLTLRWPLGFFEPYFGVGPTYRIGIVNPGSPHEVIEELYYNARVGFDFNITPVFGLGVEAQYTHDLGDLVTFDYMTNTKTNLLLKVKL